MRPKNFLCHGNLIDYSKSAKCLQTKAEINKKVNLRLLYFILNSI